MSRILKKLNVNAPLNSCTSDRYFFYLNRESESGVPRVNTVMVFEWDSHSREPEASSANLVFFSVFSNIM